MTRLGCALLVAPALAGLLGLGTRTAAAEEAFGCVPKDVHGVAPADAETAVALVCAEIRRESAGRGRYEVSLGTLGRVVILSVARIEPPRTETVRLDGIEEIDVAAPRIARALVAGEPFPTTQRVDNLLETETRRPPVKKGSVKFGVGVADVETPGFGARATSFSVGLQYATPRFSLPVDLRFATGDDSDYGSGSGHVSLFAVNVGGRAFLSTRNVSPFVGGGLGMLWLDANQGSYPAYGGESPSSYFYADSLTVAPYVEAGVEALRFHRGRVTLFVRADVPLQSLESPEIQYQEWDPRTNQPGEWVVIPGESRYVAPVSIGVTVAF